jgi:hypothetical protein
MPAKTAKDRRLLQEFADSISRCAVCWWRKYRPGRSIHIHHIVGRRGQEPHDHRNLIGLCQLCHLDSVHSLGKQFPKSLSLGHVLQAKEDEDGEVDVKFLASLLRRVGLREDPLPLPEWCLEERVENANK